MNHNELPKNTGTVDVEANTFATISSPKYVTSRMRSAPCSFGSTQRNTKLAITMFVSESGSSGHPGF